MHQIHCLLVIFSFAGISPTAAEPPATGISVKAGQGILLDQVQTRLKQLKETDLTLEFWIRPDESSILRSRSLLWLFANQAGADVAGIGLSLAAGKIQANVLGAKLTTPDVLTVNQWTHISLTIATQKLNHVATLWVQGRRHDQALVSHRWPENFFYTRLLSDPWELQRNFTGQIGPIRISTECLYQENFQTRSNWERKTSTLLLLQPGEIRLTP